MGLRYIVALLFFQTGRTCFFTKPTSWLKQRLVPLISLYHCKHILLNNIKYAFKTCKMT